MYSPTLTSYGIRRFGLKFNLWLAIFLSLWVASCKDDDDSIPTDCTDIEWSQNGENGQYEWVDLCTGYSDCGGTNQSPVNIAGVIQDQGLPGLIFNYTTTTTDIENNGHTIEFTCEAGSTLTIGGTVYDLKQFHYHTLSEHQVNGQHTPLEVHFVHKSPQGETAVVGVLFEEGAAYDLFTEYLSHFPLDEGTYLEATEIELAELLPANKSFYHYTGSLTTPPCSNGVRWYVLKNRNTASATQLNDFAGLLNSNFRNVQNLNGRTIYGRDE